MSVRSQRTPLAAFFNIPRIDIPLNTPWSCHGDLYWLLEYTDKSFILEPAVGREKAVQAIHVHREFEKLVVTLLVRRGFSYSLGA